MSEAQVRKFVSDRTAAFWKMEGERFLYLADEIKAAMLFKFIVSTCVLQGWDTDDIQNVMAVLAE